MSDLSIPREAADWAKSWLRAAEIQDTSMLRRSCDRILLRITESIAYLERTQPTRCAASILVLRQILQAAQDK